MIERAFRKGEYMSSFKSIKKNKLGTDNIKSLILAFAIPAIISNLVSSLYNIIDQIFIGQAVGMLGNAATNVTFPLTTVVVGISLLIGIGTASKFNLEMGKGNIDLATKYIGNGITYLVIAGIMLSAITLTFLQPLVTLFGATQNVMPYALTYTGITALGFPFMVMIIGGGQFIRGDGSPKYAMFTTLTGAILNIVLNPIFIFTLDLGIAGAAMATIVGQGVSALLIMNYFRKFKTISLSKSDFLPKISLLKVIVALGAASAINQMALALVQTVMNNTLTHYGELSQYGGDIPLAVVGIITKVNTLYYGLLIGIAQGTQPIFGFNYGAKDYQRVKDTLILALKMVLGIGFVTFMFFQLLPRQIIAIFGNGNELYYQFGVRYLRIFLLFTIFNGLQLLTSNFFTSIGKSSRGIFLSLTRQVLFLLPLVIILPIYFGIDGVVYAGPIADFAAVALSAIFLIREFKTINIAISEAENNI